MLLKNVLIFITSFLLIGFITLKNTKSYKCLIQMQNYTGEGAYVVISLLNSQGAYEKTLFVHGKNEDWYFEIPEWWNFYGKRRLSLDGHTGATISGGNRGLSIIHFDEEKVNKGYKLRFETAVEDKEYYPQDIEINLTDSIFNQRINGSGFIKFIRFTHQ